MPRGHAQGPTPAMASSSSSDHPVVARMLLPDDANPAGNVHGGTILKLMEESGMICAMRYLVTKQDDSNCSSSCVAALVRFEDMSFHQPMFVGEVASLSAHVVFTSPHSVLVKVIVTAENLVRGKTRITNSGLLWYVPLAAGEHNDWKSPVVIKAPQLPEPIEEDGVAREEYNQANRSYQARKSVEEECRTMATPGFSLEEYRATYSVTQGHTTPAESQQELCQIVLPGDCGSGQVAFGGFVMKLMDNAAGCSAFRHCRTNVVTVAISAIDFLSWIRLGDVCTIRSRVVFCSKKTLEIEVVASVASVHTIGKKDTLVAKGMFIFASLDKEGKAIQVPPLRLETDEDFEKAYQGQQRYEAAKSSRAKAAAAASRSSKVSS